MKLKFIRNILKGASLTTALFVFQACYGTPDFCGMTELSFKITDAESGEPIPFININTRFTDSDEPWFFSGVTDANGQATVSFSYDFLNSDFDFRFSSEDESYTQKDTSIVIVDRQNLDIKLQKAGL